MDGAHPAPTTAARTGTHGAARHRGGDTHVQSHLSSRGAAGGAGVFAGEGFTRGKVAGSLPGQRCRRGESFFPARRGSREARAPRCPRPGPAFSHGMVKSFPFVETKMLCKEEKDRSVRACGRRMFSLLQRRPPSAGARAGAAAAAVPILRTPSRPPPPGWERRKLSGGLKIMAF